MRYVKSFGVLLLLAALTSLLAFTVGADNATEADYTIEISAVAEEAPAESAESVVPQSATIIPPIWVPLTAKPPQTSMAFNASNDCATLLGGQNAPANFSYGIRQLVGLIVLDGYQGQTANFSYLLDGSQITSRDFVVPASGAVLYTITAQGCSFNLSRGTYTLQSKIGGELIIEGTAVVR